MATASVFMAIIENEALTEVKVDGLIGALERLKESEFENDKQALLANLRNLKKTAVERGEMSPAFLAYMVAYVQGALALTLRLFPRIPFVGGPASKLSQLANFQITLYSNAVANIAMNGGRLIEADRSQLGKDLESLYLMARQARLAIEQKR